MHAHMHVHMHAGMHAHTHTHTHTHTHAHTHMYTHIHTILLHSHITDGDGRTGGKDMKCLWQELQENRRVLREDFKDWNSKNNL